MTFLEKIINRIYQSYLRRKEDKKNRKRAKQKERERTEKIYKAIIEFVKKDDVDIRKYENPDRVMYEHQFRFNLKGIEFIVGVGNFGFLFTDIQAWIKVDSIELDTSRNPAKKLSRQLASEIEASIKKREEKEEEKK